MLSTQVYVHTHGVVRSNFCFKPDSYLLLLGDGGRFQLGYFRQDYGNLRGHYILARILADFGKFCQSRFQRHSSTPPQFWLILPNSTSFSFYTTRDTPLYTTSNSGSFYKIWLILPKSISRLNSMTFLGSQNSAEFSSISPLNSAEFILFRKKTTVLNGPGSSGISIFEISSKFPELKFPELLR